MCFPAPCSDAKKSQTQNLTVTYEPTDFTGSKAIKWTSSDETKVKVENGVITALAPTEKDGVNTPVVITAETVNGIRGTINVTVPEVKSTQLIINKNKTSIEKGSEETLTTSILPEDTTDKSWIFNVNNSSLSSNGFLIPT